MDFNSITYRKKDGVAAITKDNSESQYGMSRGIFVEMKHALYDAKNDSDVRVVIITAGGEGVHSIAVIAPEMKPDMSYTPFEFREIMQLGHQLTRAIETLEKPVVGVAKGGPITIAAGELPQGYKAFISGEEPDFDVQKRLTTDDEWKVLS